MSRVVLSWKWEKDVKHLKVGDKVALSRERPADTANSANRANTTSTDVVFFATPPVDGVFQEYVAHEADLCFKLPENVKHTGVARA